MLTALVHNRPMWVKLVVAFLLVGVLPLALVSQQSTKLAAQALEHSAAQTLTGLREARATELHQYFENRRAELTFLASASFTHQAASRLTAGFHQLTTEQPAALAALADHATGLGDFYQQQFGAEYQRRWGQTVDTQSWTGLLSPEGTLLQSLFIARNDNPLGQKHKLDTVAGVDASYLSAHAEFHPLFRPALEAFGYYDIFLIEAATGDVVYTVFKELDFATNLRQGAWKDTGLARAYTKGLSLKAPGEVALVDFDRYRPSYDDPASFMVTPIVAEGSVKTLLVVQMPLEPVNKIMGYRAGLGDSGQSFVFGADGRMRSDAPLSGERFSVKGSFGSEQPVVSPELVTLASQRAEGTSLTAGLQGIAKQISAVAPINLYGTEWTLVVEQRHDEATASATALTHSNLTIGLIATLLITLAGLAFSRMLTVPIQRLRDLIVNVGRTGQLDQHVVVTGKDEIGQTSAAFAGLLNNLRDAFGDVSGALDKVAAGRFETKDTAHYKGDILRLAKGAFDVIDALRAAEAQRLQQEEKIRESAREMEQKAIENAQLAEKAEQDADRANRIKQALDVCDTAVMMADANNVVVYHNHALQRLLADVEADMRKIIPGFDKNAIIGKNIDIFHKQPSYNARIVSGLRGSHVAEIQVLHNVLRLTINPIMRGNERVGTVVEWLNRTAEVAIENELGTVIEKISKGDFASTISLQDKKGFFLSLSENLNHLVATTRTALGDVSSVLKSLSEGDLTRSITKPYEGLFGELKSDVNATIDKLNEVMNDVRTSAITISDSAAEVSQGAADLHQRTEEQASSLEQTSSTMEEMTSSVRNSADNANAVMQLSIDAEKHAQQGADVMRKAVEAMSLISKSASQITEIISTIDSIAFQTNLLALNAAVEAARAGDQGRGFAVVAAEVRQLSQRSASAAREIKELIATSSDNVANGSALVDNSGMKLGDILRAVNKVGESVKEIALSLSQQSQGITEVNSAVAQLDQMTQQNAALVEEASAASETMAHKAKSMAHAVSFFKIRG